MPSMTPITSAERAAGGRAGVPVVEGAFLAIGDAGGFLPGEAGGAAKVATVRTVPTTSDRNDASARAGDMRLITKVLV